MLDELYVKDFALIQEQRIPFGPGLNIITGETGAGKSIMLGALNLVLGSKATTDLIRTGAHRSIVEGAFTLEDIPDVSKQQLMEILDEAGLRDDSEELILRREISTEGRGRSYINSRQVPVQLLRRVGRFLVDIHGQNENQNILQVSIHRSILDRYAGITSEVEALGQTHKLYQELRQKLASVSLDEAEKARRLEVLNHDIREIESAEFTTQDDFQELLNREKSLEHAEAILSAISQVYAGVQEDEDSLLSRLGRMDAILSSNIDYEESLSDPLNNLREASYHLEEAASSLRNIADSLNLDPEERSILREKIDLVQGLLRKHGPTVEEVLSYYQKAVNEVTGIELSGEEAERIRKELEVLKKKLIEQASNLSKARRECAQKLEEDVKRHLTDLGMAETKFKISIKWERSDEGLFASDAKRYVIYPTGLDIIEFLIASSEAETLRPLRKTASGGEMSRIMLALKSVIIQSDPVGTMVFDEVDAGVGGRVAEAVGHKLASLSGDSQVIVITHLHQVAGMNPPGTRHLRVARDSKAGTTISKLSDSQRIEELARMIGGEVISESAMEHARELLQRKGS